MVTIEAQGLEGENTSRIYRLEMRSQRVRARCKILLIAIDNDQRSGTVASYAIGITRRFRVKKSVRVVRFCRGWT